MSQRHAEMFKSEKKRVHDGMYAMPRRRGQQEREEWEGGGSKGGREGEEWKEQYWEKKIGKKKKQERITVRCLRMRKEDGNGEQKSI